VLSNAGLQQAFSIVNNEHPGLRGIMSWSINWDVYQNNNSFINSNSSYLRSLPTYSASRIVDAGKPGLSLKESIGMTVYPNPASGGTKVNLSFDSAPGNLSLDIMDDNGLKTQTLYFKNVEKTLELELPSIGPGLYFFKASGDKRIWVKKFISR